MFKVGHVRPGNTIRQLGQVLSLKTFNPRIILMANSEKMEKCCDFVYIITLVKVKVEL